MSQFGLCLPLLVSFSSLVTLQNPAPAGFCIHTPLSPGLGSVDSLHLSLFGCLTDCDGSYRTRGQRPDQRGAVGSVSRRARFRVGSAMRQSSKSVEPLTRCPLQPRLEFVLVSDFGFALSTGAHRSPILRQDLHSDFERQTE